MAYDIALENDDILSFDDQTFIIEVDKSVFDDFQKGKYINIYFIDYLANGWEKDVYTFVMTEEKEDSITMQLMEYYNKD